MQFIGTFWLQHAELDILKYVSCFGDYSSGVYAFSINIHSNSHKSNEICHFWNEIIFEP